MMLMITLGMLIAAQQGSNAEARIVEQNLRPEFSRCMRTGDAARGVTVAMMNCLGDEIEYQDRRLNQSYREAMRRLPATRRTRLRNLQRAWIASRDARCRQVADADGGGTLSALSYSSCVLDRTVLRTVWLRGYR